ncbi:hypothetical protein E1B28_010573 [Marasmius oreades]|uniref:Uncharacterized protein n=1 Tax=Marasmius oreades TaxID=181124 RepID=A0A9P7RXI5_9AGAR|nr:uncharacterized protein E1B28_010573 [Marasmius oreades]KAG7091544.1 hypothetical protein E1B28_010573 [Marasmius oreades]
MILSLSSVPSSIMRLRRLTLSFLLGTSFTASGQAFSSSPSQWRKPQITVSPEQRISLAANAIQETMNIFNQTSGQFNVDGNYVYSGVFYGQMADFDLATNGTRFKDLLMTYFLKAEALNPGFLAEFVSRLRSLASSPTYRFFFRTICLRQLQFGVMYGWAAVRAYSAYHESAFLGFAERSWGSMRLYTLSNNDVAAGKSPRKSVQVLKDCSGASLSGGTFYIRDDKSSTLSGLPTGLFLT